MPKKCKGSSAYIPKGLSQRKSTREDKREKKKKKEKPISRKGSSKKKGKEKEKQKALAGGLNSMADLAGLSCKELAEFMKAAARGDEHVADCIIGQDISGDELCIMLRDTGAPVKQAVTETLRFIDIKNPLHLAKIAAAIGNLDGAEEAEEAEGFEGFHRKIVNKHREKWLTTTPSKDSGSIRQGQQEVTKAGEKHMRMIDAVRGLISEAEDTSKTSFTLPCKYKVSTRKAEKLGVNMGRRRRGKKKEPKIFVEVVESDVDTTAYAYPRLLFCADAFVVSDATDDGVVTVQLQPLATKPDDQSHANRFWKANHRQFKQMFTAAGKTLCQVMDAIMSPTPAGSSSRKAFIWSIAIAARNNLKTYFRKTLSNHGCDFKSKKDEALEELHLVKTLGMSKEDAYELCQHVWFTDDTTKPPQTDIWIIVGNPLKVSRQMKELDDHSNITFIGIDEADYAAQQRDDASDNAECSKVISKSPDAFVMDYSGTTKNTAGDELARPLIQVSYRDCLKSKDVKPMTICRLALPTTDGTKALKIELPDPNRFHGQVAVSLTMTVQIDPERDREELKKHEKIFARSKAHTRGYVAKAVDIWLDERKRTGIPGLSFFTRCLCRLSRTHALSPSLLFSSPLFELGGG